jgi:flavin reductase (DIM6/NTAB) family NADH-FMN oxidoreductase RutF
MRKPWNLPSYPIYSLLTRDAMGNTNYNIMSYVIPVSLHPKHYVMALYSGTRSLKNWQEQPRGILQFLAPSHAPLVRILGKKSGKTYKKTVYLAKK